MKEYIWSPHSRVYHMRSYETERCNVDGLKHRRDTDEAPAGKILCGHCAEQQSYEEEHRK